MKGQRLTDLKHLMGALTNLSPPGPEQGLCFHWSAALALDWPGSTLVIGDLETVPPERMIHAWVEHRGRYWVPTMIKAMGGLKGIDPSEYAELNDIGETRRVPYRELAPLMRSIGFPAYVLKGRELRRDTMNHKPFGAYLLDVAGMPWQADERKGVVPVGMTRNGTNHYVIG